MANREYNVPSVEKALDIITFLKGEEHQQSTLTEIASGLGINKSSCLTILRTLQSRQFVRFDEDTRKYSLGLAFLEFATVAMAHVTFISLAKPIIERLALETHLTFFLTQRVASDTVMIMEKAESRELVHVSFPIGQRRPIIAGSTGKAFLAFMDEAERHSVLAELGLVQYTPTTITDPAKLEAELGEVRARGYAINFGEYTIGINGVAAPVFDDQGKVALVISAVGFPHVLHAGNIYSIGQQVSSAACCVTRDLNGRIPSRFITSFPIFLPVNP